MGETIILPYLSLKSELWNSWIDHIVISQKRSYSEYREKHVLQIKNISVVHCNAGVNLIKLLGTYLGAYLGA
jgi:hypothetical protein